MSNDLRGEQLVYGDFSRLMNLHVSGDMEQISHTYRTLRNLDKSLYIGFVTYVLTRAGYCNKTICEKWQISAKMYDLEFEGCSSCIINPQLARAGKVSWSNLIDVSFAWAEEVNELWAKFGEIDKVIYDLLSVMGTWSHYYENPDTKKRIKVIFTEDLPLEQMKDIKNLKKWAPVLAIDPSCSNLILVRPSVFKEARRKNETILKDLCKLLQDENVTLLSIDEFFDKFVSRAEKESEVKNWLAIKAENLENLLVHNPILIIALESKKLNEVERYLKTARQEYENAKDDLDYEHSVRDATKACEAILQILYHKHFGKKDANLTWEPLQNQLQDMIKNEFGEMVYIDLKFLQIWRNYESHPNPVIPTKQIVFQILKRSESFYESVKTTLSEFDFSRLWLNEKSIGKS